jgi:spore maturation protein CgeB
LRLLVIHPGSSFSTHDVYVGLTNALIARGHQLHTYNLDARIERSAHWLNYIWKKAGKPDPRPTHGDVVYRASVEALERALRFNVDGVLAISAMFLHPDALLLMRRAGLKTGVVFTESPYDDEPQTALAALVDVCWTNERTSVPVIRGTNPNAFYLPAAYDPDRHKVLDDVPPAEIPAHDVVFVGSGFQERIDLLSAIDWDGIDLGLYGSWASLPSRSKLRKHLRGGVVDNRYAVDLYRRAKIGLNLYRTSIGFGRKAPQIARADSLNPRAYELAACGVFQISNRRAEIVETFGYSVPTFTTAAELEALIRHYLEDARVRRSMAVAARASVAGHTFAARAAQLEAQLAQVWAEPIAKGA